MLFKQISLLLFIFILYPHSVLASNYPLEIIQPQADLDIKNRFYKAYPELEYNVRLAVIGGEYPYRYKLTTAPQGMSIDKKGIISWASPAASITPYSVSVEVLDAESNKASVSWTILVTANGFRFIDAVNGTSAINGGDGSIANPWKTMKDVYGGNDYDSKYTQAYAGEFIYWKNGTYVMDAYTESKGTRTPFVGNRKPMVWLAYPDEKPIIDLGLAYISIYGGGDNAYFDGLEFNLNSNSRGMGFQISSSANNVTFRKNKFHGLTTGYVGGNNSLIFISKNKQGSYWSFQDNEMYDVNNGYGVLGYYAKNVLLENNVFHELGGHPIGPKMGTQMWFIRANYLYNNRSNSINVQYYGGSVGSGDIEISYNFVDVGGGSVRVNTNQDASGGPMYMFRNTFLDDVQQNKVTLDNGQFYWYNNVIINDSAYANKIQLRNIETPERLIITDNLTGEYANNIVDAQGKLTPAFSQFVGQRGHQLSPSEEVKIPDINRAIVPLIILRSGRNQIQP
jgi:hypothetical protein